MVPIAYRDRIEAIYFKAGKYEFIVKGIRETGVTSGDITKMHSRGYVIETGLAASFASTRKWRIAPKHVIPLIEQYGDIHAPTSQDKIIYDYENSRKRNNSGSDA